MILYSFDPEQHYSSLQYCNIISLPFFQSDVYICMELMTTCLDKLMKKLQGPIPEDVLGKISLSVSTPCLFSSVQSLLCLIAWEYCKRLTFGGSENEFWATTLYNVVRAYSKDKHKIQFLDPA